MQRSRVQAVVLLAVAILFAGYVLRYGSFGVAAPAFSLPDPYGGEVDLASYTGHPVLLVFWTTWCPICQRELPVIDRLEPEFRGKGVSVLAICLGGENETQDYLSSNGLGLRAAYDSKGVVGRAYRVGGVPKLVLIDKHGKIKRSHSGWVSESVLREWMEAVS